MIITAAKENRDASVIRLDLAEKLLRRGVRGGVSLKEVEINKEVYEMELLVRGAELSCCYGTLRRRLNLPTCHGVRTTVGHPLIHIWDCVPGEEKNIPPFGACVSPFNQKQGQPEPCIPDTVGPWIYVPHSIMIAHNHLPSEHFQPDEKAVYSAVIKRTCYPVVTTESCLICYKYKGVIIPETSGQELPPDGMTREEIIEKLIRMAMLLHGEECTLLANNELFEASLWFLQDEFARRGGEINTGQLYATESPEDLALMYALTKLVGAHHLGPQGPFGVMNIDGFQDFMQQHTTNASLNTDEYIHGAIIDDKYLDLIISTARDRRTSYQVDPGFAQREDTSAGWTLFGDLTFGGAIAFTIGMQSAYGPRARALASNQRQANELAKDIRDAEIAQAQRSAPGQGTGRQVQFNGMTVTQNNSLFDPNAVDAKGRTNTQRMQQGLAPTGYDGKPVHIHHGDQTNTGPLVEIGGLSHNQNYSNLHTNTGQAPSQIDRNTFGQWRQNYWKWRADDFIQP